jgi:cytochrome c553
MIKHLILAVFILAVPLTLSANGNPAIGKEKAKVCEACHGPTGISIDPSYPNLAGQYEDYMVQALNDYRYGDRTNAIMVGMVGALSDQDVEDLAAWYASQEGLTDLSEE